MVVEGPKKAGSGEKGPGAYKMPPGCLGRAPSWLSEWQPQLVSTGGTAIAKSALADEPGAD